MQAPAGIRVNPGELMKQYGRCWCHFGTGCAVGSQQPEMRPPAATTQALVVGSPFHKVRAGLNIATNTRLALCCSKARGRT